MTTVPVLAEPGALTESAAPGRTPGRRFRSDLAAALFMGPAAVLLGAIVVYPAVATVLRSFYGRNASRYVGLHNYRTLFGATTFLVRFDPSAAQTTGGSYTVIVTLLNCSSAASAATTATSVPAQTATAGGSQTIAPNGTTGTL